MDSFFPSSSSGGAKGPIFASLGVLGIPGGSDHAGWLALVASFLCSEKRVVAALAL
jgi:hypothetical protein